MEKNSSNNKMLIVVGVLIILVAALLVTLCYYGGGKGKSSGNNNSNTNNGGNNTSTNTTLDLDKVINEVKEKGSFATIEKCDCTNVEDYDDYDDAECNYYNISIEDSLKIIDKLKASKNTQDMATSIACSNYSFAILTSDEDEIVTGWVGQNGKSILAGIGEDGYAFDYDEDLSSFFESLINK